MPHSHFLLAITLLPFLHPSAAATCRSFCGNLTVNYPFSLRPGCGHPAFRNLFFCINDVLMFHITSGSYRVLDIDYPYKSLTLHDPHMSNCDSLNLAQLGNGFVVEPWLTPYLNPTPDNVFMLLGCSARSPLFLGSKHPPCRNVSGLGCEEYYRCRAWDVLDPRQARPAYGAGPPHCCAMQYETIKSVNLSRLDCQGYSSAYSVAPVKVSEPGQWAYGIQVRYSVQGNESFCRACEATGGSCGYDVDGKSDLCMCENWNSTSNCDSVPSGAFSTRKWPSDMKSTVAGFLISIFIWRSLVALG